jgi:hypothetical protein
MKPSERRHTHRYGLKVPLVFSPTPSPLTNGLQAKSMNISLGGVYFVTSQPVSIGLPVQVLLRMPSRIAGSSSNQKVFTGRVSHVERNEVPSGSSGVGIEFFYCEIPPREVQQVGGKQNIEERARGEASSVSNCRS